MHGGIVEVVFAALVSSEASLLLMQEVLALDLALNSGQNAELQELEEHRQDSYGADGPVSRVLLVLLLAEADNLRNL